MIPALLGSVGAYLAVWAALGFTREPLWWASLAAPLVAGLGAVLRHRGLLGAGLYLQVGLAAAAAVGGNRTLALGAVALAAWSWDMGNLARARLGLGDPRRIRRLVLAAVGRSTGLALAGLGVGLGFSSLRVRLPFWGVVGGVAASWLALVLLLRAVGRAYGLGGEARGNRSSSLRFTG
ncbi:MAG: hypothetical protein N2320_05540 [Candidatus Bipolaricaulota bacterium]|nr:hypothetical protein [Candidatus Bipolaricaulota bacterium]